MKPVLCWLQGSKVGQKGGGMLRGRLIRPPSEVESAAVRFLRSGGDLGEPSQLLL